MNDLVSNGAFASEVAVYNGANEEEVTEFILSTLERSPLWHILSRSPLKKENG